jgi:hypothetical protein
MLALMVLDGKSTFTLRLTYFFQTCKPKKVIYDQKLMRAWLHPIYTGADDSLWVLLLAASDKGLVAVEWKTAQIEFDKYLQRFSHSIRSERSITDRFAEELSAYFSRKRRRFTFPIDWSYMREFQRRVLLITYRIPMVKQNLW